MGSAVSNPPTKTVTPINKPVSNPNAAFDIKGYFKGVAQEFKNISWPSKNQVMIETVVVIIVVALFTAFISMADGLFALLINAIT